MLALSLLSLFSKCYDEQSCVLFGCPLHIISNQQVHFTENVVMITVAKEMIVDKVVVSTHLIRDRKNKRKLLRTDRGEKIAQSKHIYTHIVIIMTASLL